MKTYIVTLVLSLFLSSVMFGQRPPSYDPSTTITNIEHVVCPANHEVSDHYVPPSKTKSLLKKKALTFVPTYSTNTPQEVITAIETRVFPLLEESFTSPVPINVSFDWITPETVGTLASAAPRDYLANFVPYVQYANVFYPLPLAEKIAKRELNEPGQPDLSINVNMNQNWCYDCDTPEEVGDRFDFVSTLYHEVYHGLGFVAFANVPEEGEANAGLGFQGVATAVYNRFLELRTGEKTIEVEEGSQELANHFQSNQLFFNLPSAGRAKVFAPNPFNGGSSISHVDEATFNNTESALMTPSSSRGEVERNAGIAAEMMYDMGWLYTYILHDEEDLAVENPIGQDFVVRATVESDNGYIADSLKLVYTYDDGLMEEVIVDFINVGGDNFEATIPARNENIIVDYHIEVVDNRNTKFTSPGINVNGLQFKFQYAFGPDEINPELLHTPVTKIKSVDTEIALAANASDVFAGLDTLVVEWRINGTDQPQLGMKLDTTDLFEDDKYIVTLDLPNTIAAGDIIEYRILAIDASSISNTTSSPETGFHRVDIEAVSGALDIYENDFNSTTEDFEGTGFSIAQPSGFADAGIHSDHPYEAAGENRTINFNYELTTPIVLKEAGKAFMEFDEIVLVEPSEPGTSFGDAEFWDYVIVEGKKLRSNRWEPFIDGYDSRADPAWFTAYSNGIVGNDSEREGNITLFRDRTIDLLESEKFVTGDTVAIRFRLFSDPFARGWGWAIDNLNIQGVSSAVEDFVATEEVKIFPNPVGDQLFFKLDLIKKSEDFNIVIIDASGKEVLRKQVDQSSSSIEQSIDVSELSSGMYFMQMRFNKNDILTRKFVKG